MEMLLQSCGYIVNEICMITILQDVCIELMGTQLDLNI